MLIGLLFGSSLIGRSVEASCGNYVHRGFSYAVSQTFISHVSSGLGDSGNTAMGTFSAESERHSDAPCSGPGCRRSGSPWRAPAGTAPIQDPVDLLMLIPAEQQWCSIPGPLPEQDSERPSPGHERRIEVPPETQR